MTMAAATGMGMTMVGKAVEMTTTPATDDVLFDAMASRRWRTDTTTAD
jgi:hypothetical protein